MLSSFSNETVALKPGKPPAADTNLLPNVTNRFSQPSSTPPQAEDMGNWEESEVPRYEDSPGKEGCPEVEGGKGY